MSAPRRSREVHAEPVDSLRKSADALYRDRDTIMGLTKDEALQRVRSIVDEGDYTPGRAECVCEEPCRYCQCEDKP